jgi:hypothetical protein
MAPLLPGSFSLFQGPRRICACGNLSTRVLGNAAYCPPCFERRNQPITSARTQGFPPVNDPLFRLLAAPTLDHARARGARLSPELDAIANENNQELREFRADQYLDQVRGAR